MGNNESVTAGNKAQADAAACDWYKLLALTGEGKNRLPGRRGGRKNIIPYLTVWIFFMVFVIIMRARLPSAAILTQITSYQYPLCLLQANVYEPLSIFV